MTTRTELIDARLLADFGHGSDAPYGTDTALAAEYGVSRELVRQRRAQYDIGILHRKAQMVDALRQRFPAGEMPRGSIAGLATELGISRSRIDRARAAAGIDFALPEHGVVRYGQWKCRCDECRAANAKRWRDQRARRDPADTPVHGRPSSYSQWKCRCDECRAAWNEYTRPYRRAYAARKRALIQDKK